MLVVLPLLAWCLGFLALRLRVGLRGEASGWRVTFLHASLAWAVAVVAITEGLSSLHLLTAGAVAACWLALAVALSALLARRRYFVGWRRHLLRPCATLPRDLWLPAGGAGVYVALTGLTAVVSPPNNWDSLVHHLSRVMHWIQDRSLDFYPTHILVQLYHPPGSEFILLHLQLLTHGDHWANLVEWFAMAGSLVGVTLIAERLGASAAGQVYSAVVCATLPVGILFASNTKPDYVEAFWLICLAYFVVQAAFAPEARNTLSVGASLGLALLTKGPAYLFALPFVAWHGLAALRARRVSAVKALVVAALVALVLNANYYRRNWALFGSPLGPRSAKLQGAKHYVNERLSAGIFVVNVLRNAALHMSTPSDRANAALVRGIMDMAAFLGEDVNNPYTTVERARRPFEVPKTNTFEDTTGNPWHFMGILAAGAVIAADKKSWQAANAARLIYAACVLAGALALSAYLKWEIYGARLHLPLFVLAAPLVGWVLEARAGPRWGAAAAFAFLALGLPWLVANKTRPLIPWRAFTPYNSILATPRSEIYYYADPSVEQPAQAATAVIAASGCLRVGLSIGAGDTPEYLVWLLLQNGPRTPRIEQIDFDWDSKNPSRKIPRTFEPCAIFHQWFDAGRVADYEDWIHGVGYQFGNVYAIVPK